MKANRNLRSLLRSLLLLNLICAASFQGRPQDIILRMDTVTAAPGDSIDIPVYASNLVNTGSFTFYISYSPAVLHFGRSLNWNPLLEPGLALSNASNGQVLVMWAWQNGVNLPEGKLFDLRFKYQAGSTLLTFEPQCEITGLMGDPVGIPIQYLNGYATRRLSLSVTATPSVLCQNDTTFLGFTSQGGLGNITWLWSSDPPGFSSAEPEPFDVPPFSTQYLISATDGHDTAYASGQVTVYIYETPAPVENMTPADSAANLGLPLLLSWSPASGTSHYDLYIWEANEEEPENPLVSNITQIHYNLNSFLQYGHTYHWRVLSKNPCIVTAGPVQTFSIRHLPDLAVGQVNVPSQAYSGQTINANFQVLNTGPGSTQTTQWIDQVYLSTDTTLETELDTYVGAYPNLTYLNPGEGYTRQIAFSLPQGISGIYFILVKTDFHNFVTELAEDNNIGRNTDSMYVFLSPVPDLRVAKIVVQSNAFSGQHIDITWTVKNFGLANTGAGPWSDRVYFSSLADPGGGGTNLGTFSHTGNTAPDSLYEVTRSIRIPDYIFGTFYLIVVTDVYNQVYEHALENNNGLVSDSIVIYLTPPPDLVTTGITVPDTASAGFPVTVQFTIWNQGANNAIPSWYDKIYLSNSLTLNTNTAFYLGQVRRSKVLMPDSSYTVQHDVTLPVSITGLYYFFVFADANLNVFEHTEEENNIARSSQPTAILVPDLTPVAVSCPDSAGSGNILNISYYTANRGPAPIFRTWTDKVFLSPLPVFIPDSSYLIGTRSVSETLIQAGDSVQQSLYVSLPNGIEGDHFLFVVNDYDNVIFEAGNEGNNAGTVLNPVYISLTPWADLVVTSVSLAPDTLTPGFPFNLSYTVANNGPGTLPWYQSWDETLILSRDSVWPSNNYFTATIRDSVELPPGASFSRTVPVVLSSGVPSAHYYLWLKADASDEIYEHGGENNNLNRTGRHWCNPYPPVDLAATSFQAPESAMSGQSIPLSWSGINQGTVPTSYTGWYDAFYLSEDTLLSPEDLYVGKVHHSGRIYPGGTYSHLNNLLLPDGIEGDFYPIVNLDYHNLNHDANLLNNKEMPRNPDGSPKLLQITFTPPPDLVIESFDCPEVAITGQPLLIPYRVRNNGAGPTPAVTWYDRFYLSTDFEISWQDHSLGNVEHSAVLEKDSAYCDTAVVSIPNWAGGNFIILMKTDVTGMIYEHGGEGNNVASQAVNIQVPPPSDLVVSQIIPPTEAETGQSVTITYTLLNQGNNPVSGQMKDLIFLSFDTTWDIDDLFFGSVEEYTSIGPGSTLTRSSTAMLTGLVPGPWYVIVRTDVLNNILESDENNNAAFGIQTIAVTVPELPLDIWVPATLTDYTYAYYRIEIPDSLQGETILARLKADSLSGNNEMYLSYEELPDRTTYDLAYGNPNAGNQEILIPEALPGTYYLLVYGSTLAGNEQAMKLHASVLPFRILSVNATRGGNTGEVTLEITGSKFTPSMAVFLEKDGNPIEGTDLQFRNNTSVFLTFNLLEADTGVYNLAADKFCDGMAMLKEAFTVAAGTLPDLQVNLYYPSAARPLGIVPVIIEYANAGNIDLIAPEVEFKSLVGAPVALSVDGLAAGQTALLLPLQELNGPPGVLRPGANGTLTVYARGTSGLAFTLELPNY